MHYLQKVSGTIVPGKYKVNNVSLKQTVFFIIHTGMHYLPIKSLTKILF